MAAAERPPIPDPMIITSYESRSYEDDGDEDVVGDVDALVLWSEICLVEKGIFFLLRNALS